jgi:hypothetical protein
MAVANEEPISVLHNLKEIKASLQKLLLFNRVYCFYVELQVFLLNLMMFQENWSVVQKS